MNAEVGNLIAKLNLDTAGFSKGAEEAQNLASKLAGGLTKTLGVATAAIGTAVTAAVAGVASIIKQSVESYGEYEQLVGGAKKIFDEMDYSMIAEDAANAWSTMNLSASQYLSIINSVGASFASTMGDAQGYETAKQGMQAIADYASGTGRSVDELNQKYAMITRSTSSYQSIADQFSGILPATSAAFLEQAQAAGYLSDSYEKLTDVPIAEYQQAVTEMLQKGVEDLGLADNTVNETMGTITGSLAGLKAAWANLITGMSDSSADLGPLIDNVVKMATAALNNIIPVASQALQGLAQVIQQIAPVIAAELPGLITTILPMLLDAAMSIVTSLTQALPDLIESLMSAVEAILPQLTATIVSLLDNLVGTILPALMDLGGQLLVSLGQAIIDNMDSLQQSAMAVIMGLIGFLTTYLPQLITIAVQIVSSIANFIAQNLPIIIPAIIQLIMVIINAIAMNAETLIMAGLTIICAVVQGLIDNLPLIIDAVVLLIFTFIQVILDNLPQILVAAVAIGLKLIEGIVMAIPNLVKSVGKMLGIVKDGKDDIDSNANQMQNSVNTSTHSISNSLDSMVSDFSAKTQAAQSSLTSTNNYTADVKDDMNKKADDMIETVQETENKMTMSLQSIVDVVGFWRNCMQDEYGQVAKTIENKTNDVHLALTNLEIKFDGVRQSIVSDCEAIASAAQDALSALEDLARMQSSASGGGGGGFGGGHASGGYVSAGTTYLVGELGPELITPTRSGYVHTAEETASMLGGESINITINGDIYDDERSMRRKMKSAVLGVLQEQMAYG